jgi:anti-sigma factor RsiW
MNTFPPDRPPPPELLAAYADGELGRAAREWVERWLEEHPEARAALEEQAELSPSNAELWDAAAPPTPAHAAWDAVLEAVARSVAPRPRWKAPLAVAALGLIGAAAAVLVAVLAFERERPFAPGQAAPMTERNAPGQVAPFAERPNDLVPAPEDEGSFRVASADDVEIHRLPESAAAMVAVGRHPLADVDLVLADPGDLEVLNYGTGDQGGLPDLRMSLGQDAPMILAAPGRP